MQSLPSPTLKWHTMLAVSKKRPISVASDCWQSQLKGKRAVGVVVA
ncbi:hypothetical protein YPPY14_0848 [Yersinia pestis PY-14]|nr:hypothetical protein YPPY14_0848 [Yersinia pestis PY-14]